MIVHLTQGMTRLALRIKQVGSNVQLTDWRKLQLLIQPGQYDTQGCGPNGSPWILTGCWPGKRTDVDIANQRTYFQTICYNAFSLDADGQVVFHLDDQLWSLPTGRYTGTLRLHSRGRAPYTLQEGVFLGRRPVPPGVIVPDEYLVGKNCDVKFPRPPDPPIPPCAPCCNLAVFDIDLGPVCSDHIIDRTTVEFALNTCGDEYGES